MHLPVCAMPCSAWRCWLEAMLLFAYGSLLNPESAERALLRSFTGAELITAELPDYALCWTSIHRIAVEGVGELAASFLNLRPQAGARALGALLVIDAAEFARLCAREKGYSVHHVQCRTETGQWSSAVTFVDERPTPRIFPPAPSAYLSKIEAGLKQLPASFATAYRAALPEPAGWVAGNYGFVDPEQKSHT